MGPTMFKLINLYRTAFAGLPREVWLLSGIALINRAGTMVVPFLSLYLTTRLGFTLSQVGTLLVCFGLGSAVGGYLGGQGSDRFGSIPTQIASLVLGAVSFLFLAHLKTITSFALGVFFLAATSEAFRPANMAAIVHATDPKDHPRALGLLRLGINAGMSVGPAVGGWIALRSYRALFYLDAGTALLAALALAFSARWMSSSQTRPKTPQGTSAAPLDRRLYILYALVFLVACVFLQFLGALPLYWHDHFFLPENDIGLIYALNTVLIIVLEMVLIAGVKGSPRAKVAGVGALLICLGFGAMPWHQSVPFLLLTVVVWTVGEMLFFPMANTMVAEFSPEGQVGKGMGLFTMVFSLAWIVGPSMGLQIVERFGATYLWTTVLCMGPLIAFGFKMLADIDGPSYVRTPKNK